MTYEQALNKAAALCSGAEYCERQILEKLRRWEIGEDDAERDAFESEGTGDPL